MDATPAKLKSGEWGARVAGTAKPGERLTIKSKTGKSWNAIVERVVWSGNGVSLCALAAQRQQSARRVSSGCWLCPMCDEENDASARSCWECGCGR